MRDPADKAFVSHINNIPMFFTEVECMCISIHFLQAEDGESLTVSRTIQPNPNRNLKSKLYGKSSSSLACLPSLPNVLGKCEL